MTEPRPQEVFEYDDLDEPTREFVQRKADETHGLMKRTAEHIIQIGQNLLDVQQLLPEMKFSAWLRAEFALSRQTAYNFMRVATKFGGSCKTVLQLPATILYELASSSDDIIQRVEKGGLPPTLDAIKAAKEAERVAREAERRARAEAQAIQQQLSALQQVSQEQQATIEQLTRDLEAMQDQLTTVETASEQKEAKEKPPIPTEITAQMHELQHQLTILTRQRDTLSQEVTRLQEEAQTEALKRLEGEQERRIRLQWYKTTTEFQRSIRAILSQWPAPLDALAFEAEDWNRLSQTKELAQRLLEECTALLQARVVDSHTTVSAKERAR